MSYYGNPFYNTRSAPSPFGFNPFAPAHLYAAQGYEHDDYEAEERAALAHLRSIQQRKEAAQLAARREAAIRARIAAEREAAIAAAVERERAREQAIRHAIAVEQHRRALFAEQYQIEMERRRRAIAAQEAAKAIEANKRAVCARRCAESCARPCAKKEDEEFKDINDFLGALFGLNFDNQVDEPKPAQSVDVPKAEGKTVEDRAEDKVQESKVEKEVPKPAESPKKESTPAVTPKEDVKSEIDLENLISSFLGFNVAPATSTDKSTPGSEQITERLNDFLGQFGLEFEPIKNGGPSTAAKSSPVETEQSATTGKGKAVAEGEKPVQPTPAPATTSDEPDSSVALNKLRDISHELHLATESFTFPAQLAFAPTPSADEAVPALLFNKQNSKYHAQTHKLLQLLLAVDGVSSGGDREVRKQRKALVKAIEGAIEALEVKRDAAWKEVKEKRERGEESDDEGSVGSWATDYTDDHHSTPVEPEVAAPSQEEKEVEGFEVPAPEHVEKAEEVVGDQVDVPQQTTSTKNEEVGEEAKENKDDAKAKVGEKEDGFEIL